MAQSGASLRTASSPTVSSSVVGQWVHDPQGNIIGSVRGLTSDGRSASIMVGSYFQPGSHEVMVRAQSISTVNGRVVIDRETAQVLSLRPRG